MYIKYYTEINKLNNIVEDESIWENMIPFALRQNYIIMANIV